MKSKRTVVAAALCAAVAVGCWHVRAADTEAEPPVIQPNESPPGGLFGPNGPVIEPHLAPHRRPAEPSGAATAPEKTAPPPSRAAMLDRLFARLAQTDDETEAPAIAQLIEQTWMQSGSDTADLIMARAMDAMRASKNDVALTLFDRLVAIAPDWAEAWNKRATLRYLEDDDAGAMADIGHVLALEPRHFGALSGMGYILKRNGLDKEALTVFIKAHGLYPENPDIRKAVEALRPEVEGRDL